MDFLVQVVALCCVLTVSYSATIKKPTIEEACTSCTESGCLAPWSSCEEYLECQVGGGSLLRRCPHGLHFSRDLKRCDWPADANCTNDPCKKNLTRVAYAATDHCRRYWECAGEVTSRYSIGVCCKDNKTFDATTNSCLDMSPSNCNDTCVQNDNSTDPCKKNLSLVAYAATDHCRRYWECAGEVTSRYSREVCCKDNKAFDATTNSCLDMSPSICNETCVQNDNSAAAPTPACNLDITLTFDSNSLKYKGAWPDVRQSSKGESFGAKDSVHIPFYNRNGLSRFAGRILFESSPTVHINETLISKCAQTKDNSFMVKLDTSEEHIYFQLDGNTILKLIYKPDILNALEFFLENGIIDAKVMVNDTVSGNLKTISSGQGSLSSIQKEGAVTIGHATCKKKDKQKEYPGFTGKIKEIKFAKCNFLMKKSSAP